MRWQVAWKLAMTLTPAEMVAMNFEAGSLDLVLSYRDCAGVEMPTADLSPSWHRMMRVRVAHSNTSEREHIVTTASV